MNDINDNEMSVKCDDINLIENFDVVSIDELAIEEKNNVNYDDKCRGCESQVNLCSLFENSENLSKKFTLCTSLKVFIFNDYFLIKSYHNKFYL